MPIINVTVAGAPLGSVQRVNVSAQEASDPDALFGRLQDSLGVPIGELRCARTGALVSTGADIIEPEDALIVIPDGTEAFRDDPAPLFPGDVVAEMTALSRLRPSALTFLDDGSPIADNSATAFTVSLSPAVARGALGLVAGRRYTLLVGHAIYASGAEADVAIGDVLRAEWGVYVGAIGGHSSIASLHTHWLEPPPTNTLTGLPPKVLSALSAFPKASLSMLLTDATFSLSYERAPFSRVFGYALDLLRGCVHLARCRVSHRALSPGRLRLASTVSASRVPGSDSAASIAASEGTPGRLVITRMSCAISFRRGISDGGSASDSAAMVQRLNKQIGAAESALLELCSSVDAPYVAPELHTAARALKVSSPSTTDAPIAVSCAKADVWSSAAALLTMALGNHPLVEYPGVVAAADDAGGASGAMIDTDAPIVVPVVVVPRVNLATVPALPCDFPPAFGRLLLWMLRPNPAMRITAFAALARLESLALGCPMRASPFLNIEPGAGGTGVALRAALPNDVPHSGMGAALTAALSGTGIIRTATLRSPRAAGDDGSDGEGEGVTEMNDEDGGSGKMNEDDMSTSKAAWSSIVGAVAVALLEGTPADAESFVPIAAVPYAVNDNETVAAVIARAAELLDLTGYRTGGLRDDTTRTLALPALLDSRNRRIDPLVPFHRLPERMRSGAALRLALAADVPEDIGVFVEGFGCTVMPAPPQRMPAAFLPATGMSGMAGMGLHDGMAAAIIPISSSSAAATVTAPAHISSDASYLPGLAPSPSSAQPLQAAERLAPGYTFSPLYRSDNVYITENGTVVSTRAQWGSTLLAQGRVGLSAPGSGPPLPTRFSVSFTVRAMEAGSGLAIGLVDPERFDARSHVFGNAPGSWGYSRTGKISDGSTGQWVEYGEPFGVGDVIQLDVTVNYDVVAGSGRTRDNTSLRFFKNGVPQGKAFVGSEMLATLPGAPPVILVPAVCLGSNSGGKNVSVEVHHPEVYDFDFEKRHPRIQFSEDGSTVSNEGKWATTLVAHPGVRTGRLVWSVRLDDTRHGAGVAIGVVDATNFHWERQNLGASRDSWCYSKTGKKGDGSGFHEYGKPYTVGDTITLTLDMDARELSFAVNGESQGVAYSEKDGIGQVPLVPAVCLGSTEGKKLATVSIVGLYPLGRRFDRFACSKKVVLKDLCQVAETYDKWGTVFLDHAGLRTGRYSFGITIASAGSGCGVGIGFADLNSFDPTVRNLGAHKGSYCLSKTGKISLGTEFVAYGHPFKSNDVVTAEVDMDQEILRFYINGRPQGDKKVEGLKGLVLVPAVVLGSGDGGHHTKLTIGLPAVSRFDPRRMHKQMTLKDDDRTAHADQRWCTVLADHPGVMAPGVLRFAVRLEGDGGSAIGFAEASSFRPYAQNLGASPFTWAISKTGKISSGDAHGFQHFSERFAANDIIGAEADLNEGIIRFWKNGGLLGTAFSSIDQRLTDRALTLVPAVCLGSNSGGKPSSATLVDFDDRWIHS